MFVVGWFGVLFVCCLFVRLFVVRLADRLFLGVFGCFLFGCFVAVFSSLVVVFIMCVCLFCCLFVGCLMLLARLLACVRVVPRPRR